MADFDRDTLPIPDELASAMDLQPDGVAGVLGPTDTPTGYLIELTSTDPEAMLELWQTALERLAPVGYRPVLYEPWQNPGGGDVLREEPGALTSPHRISIASAETGEEAGNPVYRSAEDVLQAAHGNDIEQTLLSPEDATDPEALADLDVPADALVQLPSGATSRVDYATSLEEDVPVEPADLFLAVVKAAEPGEALARVFLGGHAGTSGDLAEMVSMLRAWHDRYCAELLQVKDEAAMVELWVPNPPQREEECFQLGREALAFWRPWKRLADIAARPLVVGHKLAQRRVWSFSSGLGP